MALRALLCASWLRTTNPGFASTFQVSNSKETMCSNPSMVWHLGLGLEQFNLNLQTSSPGFYLRNFQANLTRLLLGLGDRIGQSKTE